MYLRTGSARPTQPAGWIVGRRWNEPERPDFDANLTRFICSVPYVCSIRGDSEVGRRAEEMNMSSLALVRDDDRDVLTDRQRESLEFIPQSIGERGDPPTLREI